MSELQQQAFERMDVVRFCFRKEGMVMENKQEIISEFVHQVTQLLGKSLSKVILYGSYARGDNNENSDIDIMLLTSLMDEEIEQVENSVFDLAFEFQMKYFIDISVVIKNEEQFNYWLGAVPFYNNVKREGVILNG